LTSPDPPLHYPLKTRANVAGIIVKFNRVVEPVRSGCAAVDVGAITRKLEDDDEAEPMEEGDGEVLAFTDDPFDTDDFDDPGTNVG
jgi:hypothetical protein